MKLRRLFLLPLLALLTACGGEKFPYPPQFVTPDDVPPHVLAVPAPKYSTSYDQQIEEIIRRQATLTDAQKVVLREENHITPEMVVKPVLGAKYTPDAYPVLYTLLKHAASDAWRIGDRAQDYWQTPRPWYADARVQLLVPYITRPGYPSGHTVTNHVWAHVLSELFPQKRDALFARAWEIGQHRIDGGAHFPRDVEAGKYLAEVIYAHMKKVPAFQQELAAAKAELKKPLAQRLRQGKTPHCTMPDANAAMAMCR